MMTYWRKSGGVAGWLLAMILLAVSCGSSDDSSAQSSDVSTTTTSEVSTESSTGSETVVDGTDPNSTEPLFGSFDYEIDLLTATEGGGTRPVLEWSEVPDADHYGVYLYAPSGEIYWAWRGYTTSIVVGGEPRLADTSPGPSVVGGMSWAVVAYSADLLPLAVSPEAAISP